MRPNLNRFMKRIVWLAIAMVTALRAQYPPDIQWRKIVTAHFEVVFPRELAADAERAANTLEALYGPLTRTLGADFKRTTVLLPNAGVTRYVGGYVSLFPRMAVFNSMPAQGFWGTNDWLNTLAADEGRNLAQIAKMNHAFGKLGSTLLGESGLAMVLGWTLPDWWFEGDARVAETTMLRGGIGQFASSEEATRALLLSGQHFSYMKAMHGSFTDALPSQAELGAFLVSHVDRTSGPQAWDKIMTGTAKWGWNPFALGIAMKKETGRNASTTYDETMSQLGEMYKSKAEQTAFMRPLIVNTTPKNVFTGYFQPVFEADGSVLAQKTGMDIYPIEIVRLHPDGREEKLFRVAPTVNGSNRTSVVNGKMVLDEYVPDLRWRRGYSEILIRDVATGHTRRLTHHTRFMNPALSPDGARVAVVEFLPDRKCSLVVLDASTGGEVRRLPSPGNDMIYSPVWSADGRRAAMVTQSRQGRALQVADVESGSFREVIPHSDEDMANPVFFGDYVLYKSSRDGVNNIYAVAMEGGRRFRVTASQFGADCPAISPDGKTLLYSDYTYRGNNVAELPLDPASWTPIEAVVNSGLNYHGNYHDYSVDAAATQYPVERYRPSLNLFDFHSWGLTSGPPNLGFGLLSNDKMGLMDFDASLIYNTNERTTGFVTGLSYNGFYPALDLSAGDQNRSVQFVNGSQDWNERTVNAGFHIPLNLSRGYYNTGLDIGAGVESVSRQGGGLVPLSYGLTFSRVRQSSPRDLAPVWGQLIQFTYRQTPWANNYTANYLFADGRFALPGLARHHSIVVEGGYERQTGNYYFPSQMAFPRGYLAIAGPELTKLSSNYEMPLLYPDLALSQLVFVKRVSSNVFYDYGKVADRQFRSTGLELIFDLGVLHFPFDFRFGMRYACLLDYQSSRVQPFLAFGW